MASDLCARLMLSTLKHFVDITGVADQGCIDLKQEYI